MDAQVIAGVFGVVAGLVGAYVHRNGQVRSWLPHLAMGAAMGAMLLPRHDPLGPAGWMLLLAGAAAWALGRPQPGLPRPRVAVALDLYVMGVLTLLMPALHSGHGAHPGGNPSSWWLGPYIAVLAIWATARIALAATPSPARSEAAPNSRVTSACSAAMMAAMTLMAFAP
ncbi:DUF5134 domain-containing protein [Yinghuangia sp. YIM S09857]|uniref:DUF5134 domain-containing protein n=1 Tax=Yinghuangia sp. YIM S09857 TaxID=3436929 RepID=UPI003F53B827